MTEPLLQISGIDLDEGTQGFVVVDTLVGGRAMGGTRMTGTVTMQEVAHLARRMTHKLALARIPLGGAKAGIVSDLPLGRERDHRLEAFGRMVRPLLHGGVYLGSDQGVSHRDRDVFLRAAGFDVRDTPWGRTLACGWEELWERCEDVTGFGICAAIDAAVPALARPPAGATLALQGFGAVGRSVAKHLHARGLAVVAVADRLGMVSDPGGLPLEALFEATDALGTIDRDGLPAGLQCTTAPGSWIDVDCDVLVLAAGGDAVHAGNVGRVQARLVVEAANAACTPAAVEELAARSIPVLPDIAVNVGGAAVTGLVLAGLVPDCADPDELVAWLYSEVGRRIRTNVTELVERAVVERRTLAATACDLAEERLAGLVTARVAAAPETTPSAASA